VSLKKKQKGRFKKVKEEWLYKAFRALFIFPRGNREHKRGVGLSRNSPLNQCVIEELI